MIDTLFQKKPRRHIQDLNIVPILDMLTTVIFFLLLSTSFIEFTKLTVPPSVTATVSDPIKDPPLSPKILLIAQGSKLKVILRWGGKSPGQEIESIARTSDLSESREAILKATEKVAQKFITAHPGEKTIQVSLGSELPYQHLISVMDGVRPVLPDVVLVSYSEADVMPRALNQEGS